MAEHISASAQVTVCTYFLSGEEGQLVPEDAWLFPAASAAAVCELHQRGNTLATGSRSPEDAACTSQVSCYIPLIYWSRDTSVSVVSGWMCRQEQEFGSRKGLGPGQLPIQWLQGVKWPGREANHLLQSSDKVKNGYSYIFTLSYVCMKCSLNICPVLYKTTSRKVAGSRLDEVDFF
jgi:hypothetical protein